MVTQSLSSVNMVSATGGRVDLLGQTLQPFSTTTLSSSDLVGSNATETSAMILVLRHVCRMVNTALVWLLTYLQYDTN